MPDRTALRPVGTLNLLMAWSALHLPNSNHLSYKLVMAFLSKYGRRSFRVACARFDCPRE